MAEALLVSGSYGRRLFLLSLRLCLLQVLIRKQPHMQFALIRVQKSSRQDRLFVGRFPPSLQLAVKCLRRNADILRNAAPVAARRQSVTVEGEPSVEAFRNGATRQQLYPRPCSLDFAREVPSQFTQ